MPAQTLYLEAQVLAREAGGAFRLDVSPETLSALLDQGVSSGDALAVVDAAQDYYPCEVLECGASGLLARFAARPACDARPRVHLVQGLSNDEAMDTIVRQVSELGVAGIMCYRGMRSPEMPPGRGEELQARWSRLARFSARHAGLADAPDVGFPDTLEEMCATLAGFDAVLVCWEGEASCSMDDAVRRLGLRGAGGCDVALVVGPRGGLDGAEVAAIAASNRRLATVGLGPAILRVETAGLVAPALLISALGGLR